MANKSNITKIRTVRPKKPKTTTHKKSTKKIKKIDKNIKNYKDLEKATEKGLFYRHHTSWRQGYISRKIEEKDFPIESYDGRFGKGYKVSRPSWSSSQYSLVDYYIEND